MTAFAIVAFIALLLGCLADAQSTNALIRRGGYEIASAWLIGKYPKPLAVWLVIGLLPAGCCAMVLWAFPEAAWLVLCMAGWRGYQAIRNNRLQR